VGFGYLGLGVMVRFFLSFSPPPAGDNVVVAGCAWLWGKICIKGRAWVYFLVLFFSSGVSVGGSCPSESASRGGQVGEFIF
jgi:hypothetical protein